MNVSCPECRSVFRVDPTRIPATGVRARCSVCGGVIILGAGSSIEEEFGPTETPVAAAAISAVRDASPEPATALPELEFATPASAHAPPPVVETLSVPARAAEVAPAAPPPRRSLTPPRPAPAHAPQPARPLMSPPARPTAFPPRAPAAAAPVSAPRQPMSGTTRAATPARPLAPPMAAAFPPRPTASPVQRGATQAQPPRPASPTPSRLPINPFLANDPNAKARRLSRALISDLVTYYPQRRDEGLREGTLRELFREEIKKSYEEYVEQVGKEFADTTSHFQDALNEILAGGQKIF